MSKKGINILKKYGSDLSLEIKGAKFYLDEESDSYIVVSRVCTRNIDYVREQAELVSKLDGADEMEINVETGKVFIRHLVKGWNNIIDDNDEIIEFTTEKALEILLGAPELLTQLIDFALNRENYISREEDVVKN